MNRDMTVLSRRYGGRGMKDIRVPGRCPLSRECHHEMGTARMAGSAHVRTHGFNQMHEVKNVFITDGPLWLRRVCQPFAYFIGKKGEGGESCGAELRKEIMRKGIKPGSVDRWSDGFSALFSLIGISFYGRPFL